MPPNSRITFEGIGLNFGKHEIQMWLLGFNLCDNLTMDEADVDNAVQAFLINDPYYPRQAQESDGEGVCAFADGCLALEGVQGQVLGHKWQDHGG
jgi:Zinc finger protein